jgi:hypothetical protein
MELRLYSAEALEGLGVVVGLFGVTSSSLEVLGLFGGVAPDQLPRAPLL